MLGCTSLAQLSTWQDYASRQLFIQQISIPPVAKNNVRILPRQTGIVSLVVKPSKTSFVPCHTITGKVIAYVRPLDLTLPLRPVETEFENNRCCLEVCNTSDSTIEFQYGHEVKIDNFHDVFSLRDEIGTCPFIEVHLKLKDETPLFVRPYHMWEEQKKVIQKEMDRLEHLDII